MKVDKYGVPVGLGLFLFSILLIYIFTTHPKVTTEKHDINNPADPRNIVSPITGMLPPPIERIENYRNGVYFFPFIGADFGNGLSAFLTIHTNLEVTAMGIDLKHSAPEITYPIGYFVTFREKK